MTFYLWNKRLKDEGVHATEILGTQQSQWLQDRTTCPELFVQGFKAHGGKSDQYYVTKMVPGPYPGGMHQFKLQTEIS